MSSGNVFLVGAYLSVTQVTSCDAIFKENRHLTHKFHREKHKETCDRIIILTELYVLFWNKEVLGLFKVVTMVKKFTIFFLMEFYPLVPDCCLILQLINSHSQVSPLSMFFISVVHLVSPTQSQQLSVKRQWKEGKRKREQLKIKSISKASHQNNHLTEGTITVKMT